LVMFTLQHYIPKVVWQVCPDVAVLFNDWVSPAIGEVYPDVGVGLYPCSRRKRISGYSPI
jgi:hypothetical protein